MNRSRLLLITAIAIALAAPGAPAQKAAAKGAKAPKAQAGAATSQSGPIKHEGPFWVQEETGTIPSGTKLEVLTSQGGIEFRGAAQQQITYTIRRRVAAMTQEAAEHAFSVFRAQTRRIGNIVQLFFDAPPMMAGDLSVVVPNTLSRADLQTRLGGISAQDFAGELHASAAGSLISVDRIGGPVELLSIGGPIIMGALGSRAHAETEIGDIRLGSAKGDVALATGGGDVVAGRVTGSVTAQSDGGEIHVEYAGGNIRAQTLGGDMAIGEGGVVEVYTGGGAIQINKARNSVHAETQIGPITVLNCLGPVRAQTGFGNIIAKIGASKAAWAQSSLQTAMGDIKVAVPSNLPLSIQAAVDSANRSQGISSDVPLTASASRSFGPGGIFKVGSMNGGGPPLQLRTVNGTIEIRSQ
jgi:DUF4097 and DUF4098 domain-containing protein YvlB